jgi:hypothetical protein
MKNKMITMVSVLGILLIFGTASAMAQNMNSGNIGDMQNHKCTPEMMTNMNANCPKNMMTSTATNTMMGSGMMGGGSMINGNNNGGCKGMNPGSMMGSGGMSTKGMM